MSKRHIPDEGKGHDEFVLGALSFEVSSRESMHELGGRLHSLLQPGDIVALAGPMGAGKTTLVQGVAWALGLPKEQYAQSPTYAVALTYPTTPALNHLDLYRVAEGASELLGDSYFGSDAITFIEWAELAPEVLEQAVFRLRLELVSEDARLVHLDAASQEGALRLVDWATASRRTK